MGRYPESFIEGIPKSELHLHIEGTLEPELHFEIGKRNSVTPKYKSVNALKNAYRFGNLQDFLNIYYEGSKVLLKEQDFYDLTLAYLEKAHNENVLHAEIFFDPQTHTDRNVRFEIVINGLHRALEDAKKKYGLSTKLIMCFLRDSDLKSAFNTLEEALPYKDLITAVGLDSAEVGNPPSKYKELFDAARQEGFLTVAHAGEEGPAEYVREAVDLLKVSRIDHGNHSLDDEDLIQELVSKKIPLTLCPLSNLKLRVIDKMENHPLKKLMMKGVSVTINSDDPAYFGGYINANYLAVQKALHLDRNDFYILARNSFEASFLTTSEKQKNIGKLDEFMAKSDVNAG
jgi:adenosine deaminase